MVLLGSSAEEQNSSDAREYLESTDLLPTLEACVNEMLKKFEDPAARSGAPGDALLFMAEWLKRHNPRFDAAFAEKIVALRAAPRGPSGALIADSAEAALSSS